VGHRLKNRNKTLLSFAMNWLRFSHRFSLLKPSSAGIMSRISSRLSSGSSTEPNFEEATIQASIADDGKTIVCWHPEVPFPYNHTKPIPKIESSFEREESLLKLVHRMETDTILRNRDYTEEELMQKTYTTRKCWHKNKAKRQAHLRKPNPPIDRIGI
jgi:large subunit ribosomal protein L42